MGQVRSVPSHHPPPRTSYGVPLGTHRAPGMGRLVGPGGPTDPACRCLTSERRAKAPREFPALPACQAGGPAWTQQSRRQTHSTSPRTRTGCCGSATACRPSRTCPTLTVGRVVNAGPTLDLDARRIPPVPPPDNHGGFSGLTFSGLPSRQRPATVTGRGSVMGRAGDRGAFSDVALLYRTSRWHPVCYARARAGTGLSDSKKNLPACWHEAGSCGTLGCPTLARIGSGGCPTGSLAPGPRPPRHNQMNARITRVVDAASISAPGVWDRQRSEKRRRSRQAMVLNADGRVTKAPAETPERVRRFADAEIARYLARKG